MPIRRLLAILVPCCALLVCSCAQSANAGRAATRLHSAAAGQQRRASAARRRPAASPSHTGYVVRIGKPGRAIPAGFLGLSLEQAAMLAYTGPDPSSPSPVFVALIRNLSSAPVLRIGGDTTDWDWYRVPGMATPPWVKYTITPTWLAAMRTLAARVGGRLILGVNLEANSARIARAEADAMLADIGRPAIAAFELGNEPELYASFNWYRTRSGVGVKGRPPGWDAARYIADFRQIAAALPADVPVAGPAAGGPEILRSLGAFLSANSRVKLVTVHAYPLKRCTAHSPLISTAQVVAESSSLGLAHLIGSYVRTAAGHGVQLRLDEINAISCGGQQGVSNSFATALWALDTCFAMAQQGVAGVNFHTNPAGPGRLFAIDGRRATVYPIYYGLYFFSQAAPPGSRLLSLSGNAVRGTLRAWATRGADGRTRVVLINTGARAQTVAVRAPGATATLELLTAPRLGATGDVRIGGQSFGARTSTGRLSGAPALKSLSSSGGDFTVRLPASSAALLTSTGS